MAQTGVYKVTGKKGISWGIYFIHPQTGQRVRKILQNATSETGAAEIRAIEIADAKRGAVNQAYGIKSASKAVSFEKMVDEYLEWSKENKGSFETDDYRARPLKAFFKGKLMSDIKPFLVEKYKSKRLKDRVRASSTKSATVGKSTINKELILGSQVFEKAIEWEKWEGENPFQKSRFEIKKGKKPGSLSPDEVQAIMDHIDHPVKKDMVLFDFNTGWRISEIRKLKWEDVNLEAGTAWVTDPKNGHSVEVELSDTAKEIIERQTKRSIYVFCKLNGDPWKTNIPEAIKAAARDAGVTLPSRKAWHILRRTWASMFLQAGGDVETLRQLGNWKDYSMPMWYADAANAEHKRKILNKLPKLGVSRNPPEIEKDSSVSESNQ